MEVAKNRMIIGAVVVNRLRKCFWLPLTVSTTVKTAFCNLCGQRPPAFYDEIPCTDDSVQKSLCGRLANFMLA